MEVRQIIEETSGGDLRTEYLRKLEKELYPSAFANPDSWLAVKRAFALHDAYVKEYVIRALEQLNK